MKTKQIRSSAVFFLCFAAYTGIYIARLNLSMASPAMRDAGLLTAAQLGFIGSAFSVVYACGRLFNGVLGDRLAPRLLIVTGLGLTAAANLLIGTLPPYLLMLVLWCVNAFGQSMLWSSMLRTMTGLYGKAQADKKVSILVSSVSVGNILGILLSTFLVTRLGIRAAFLIPGGLTALMGLLCIYVLPQPPARAGQHQTFPWKALVTDRSILGILLPSMFHGTMKDTISLFMAVYFLDRFRVDLESSAWYVLLIPVVGLVGRLLYPVCYRLARRREHMISILCFALCTGLAAVLWAEPATPLLAAVCLSLIYALVSMINTSILSMFPLRFAARGLVSSVSGITDFATYLGAAIASAIYGIWIDGGRFGPMFLSWIILSILSIAVLLFQHPFRKEQQT